MRDLFRSEWEHSPVKGVIAEFLMGHDIDPNDHNKFYRDEAYTGEAYEMAEPWLNIMSEEPGMKPVSEVRKLERRVKKLEEENKQLKAGLNGTPAQQTIDNLQDQVNQLSENWRASTTKPWWKN